MHMKLGYTEFSFGYAFTENLIRSTLLGTASAPFFPNLIQEAQLGYDVHIDLPGFPLYLQYKLPELMVRDTAKEISKYALPGLYTPFFRMNLMKRDLSHQHELLIVLEKRHPNSVYYVAPCMESIDDFNGAYNLANIHCRSFFFSPMSIGHLPDDQQHVVAYRDGLKRAWLCSEPHEINFLHFDDIASRLNRSFEEPRYRTLREVARHTMEDLFLLVLPIIRDTESAIRQQIRVRRRNLSRQFEIDNPTEQVVEDLLVSRQIARVGLGLDLLIAQPLN